MKTTSKPHKPAYGDVGDSVSFIKTKLGISFGQKAKVYLEHTCTEKIDYSIELSEPIIKQFRVAYIYS